MAFEDLVNKRRAYRLAQIDSWANRIKVVTDTHYSDIAKLPVEHMPAQAQLLTASGKDCEYIQQALRQLPMHSERKFELIDGFSNCKLRIVWTD